MARLIIFKALPNSEGWENRTFPDGSLSDILSQQHDYSGMPAPAVGYRLTESKHDQASATIDHQGGVTHERLSPWRVVKTEEYPANTGMEEFSEIVIAYCELSPLPDEENPWIELGAAIVSPDSFGGDVAAYQAWKATHGVGVS